jgi:hypothetical protein
MKTHAAFLSLGGCVCMGMLLSFAANASAQNLFVSCEGNNSIVEITPGDVQSTFVSGLDAPAGLAFDSAGNLFEADEGSGNIYEYKNINGILSSTPVLFLSGLDDPNGLVFNLVTGVLFVSEYGNGDIAEIIPGESPSTVATGLNGPESMILTGPGGPLPELTVANQKAGSLSEIPLGLRGTMTLSVSGAPSGLVDLESGLYYTDQQNGALDKVTESLVGLKRTVTVTTLISGLNDPNGLVAEGDNLFEADTGSGEINEMIGQAQAGIPVAFTFTETNFASGLDKPVDLAFQPAPEPSILGLMATGFGGIFLLRRQTLKTRN